MNPTLKLCIAALLAAPLTLPPAYAERIEELPIQNGTPTSIIWTLDKNGADPETVGSAFFQGGMPGTLNPDGPSVWKIPAFDDRGGTRKATGFSVNYQGGLKARFHADAATTHNRKIEGETSWIGLIAGVDTGSWNHQYETQPAGWTIRKIPAAEQAGTLDWRILHRNDHQGWIVRDAGSAERQETFTRIRDGEGVLELSASYRWLPYFELKRDWFGTGTYTFQVDTSTTEWDIPGETASGTGEAYPADFLGRRINHLAGMPGYPVGYQAQYEHNYVNTRTGAAEPLTVTVIWHYTEAGDADHGNPYFNAGAFAADFRKADNLGQENRHPDFETFVIPGNRELEYGEFSLLLQDDTAGSGGFELYDWEAAAADDPAKGRTRRTHYLWMDADRSGGVSMAEYRAWREFIKVAVTEYSGKELIKLMPDANWEEMAPPVEAVVTITGGGGGGEKTPTPSWKLLFRYLDGNDNKVIGPAEWLAIYPKKPKKETGFAAADLDKDGGISPEEFEKVIVGNSGPVALKGLYERRRALRFLDRNHDLKIDRKEYVRAHLPGTPNKTIDGYWKKLGLKPAGELGLQGWMKAKTLPGVNTYREAYKIRVKRREVFEQADSLTEGGNKDGSLNFSEFQFLFRPGTKAKTIESSWKTASGSKTKAGEIGSSEFLRCKLVGTSIR